MRMSKYIFLMRKFCRVYNMHFKLPDDYRECIPTSWTCLHMDIWTQLVAQVVYNDVLNFLKEECQIVLQPQEKKLLLQACYQRQVFSTIDALNKHYHHKKLSFFVFYETFMEWLLKKS